MKKNLKKYLIAKIVCGLVLASMCLSPFASFARVSDVPDRPISRATAALEECGESVRDGQTCRLNISAGAGKKLIMDTSKPVTVKESGNGCSRVGFVQTPAMNLEWLGQSGARLAGGNTTVSFITTSFGNCALTIQGS